MCLKVVYLCALKGLQRSARVVRGCPTCRRGDLINGGRTPHINGPTKNGTDMHALLMEHLQRGNVMSARGN